MTNLAAPISSIYNGLFFNAVDNRMEMYFRGTKVSHVTATTLQVDQVLDVNANIEFSGTLAPDSKDTVSGDTSTYAESAITGALSALATIGLLTDSTT